MSGQKLKDAIDNLAADLSGYGDSNVESLDIRNGGLNGVLPSIAVTKDDVVFGNWISNTPAVSGRVHAVLLDYPKFFDMCGDGASKILRGKLSSFISTHSEVIEGINDSITWEYDDSTPIGSAGETIQQITNATITKTEPSITVTEKIGNPIRNLLTFIGRYGILDPYADTNLAFLLPNYEKVAWTLDMDSFSMMVYELDPTGTQVVEAQIVANMKPQSNGEYTLKKDVTASKEIRKYTIAFTGFGIRGNEVRARAQDYLDKLMESTKDALLTPSLYDKPVDELASDAITGTLYNTNQNL